MSRPFLLFVTVLLALVSGSAAQILQTSSCAADCAIRKSTCLEAARTNRRVNFCHDSADRCSASCPAAPEILIPADATSDGVFISVDGAFNENQVRETVRVRCSAVAAVRPLKNGHSHAVVAGRDFWAAIEADAFEREVTRCAEEE